MINKLIREEIEKVSEVASYLWQREWCERNAGNISVDLTGLAFVEEAAVRDKPYIEWPMPPEAAGKLIYITGTGERLRELISKPERVSCIILTDQKAKGYYIVWGGEGNPSLRPTSEFISHLSIHLYNAKAGNNHRCVLHTHPTELIAISHHPVFGHDEEALNKAVWSMLPETRVFIPRGICLAPYTLPGSEELAKLTIAGLKYRDVVLWCKHGALATGVDVLQAFDYIDVANKGVNIYMKCMQAGYVPEGMSDDEMKALEIFI